MSSRRKEGGKRKKGNNKGKKLKVIEKMEGREGLKRSIEKE